MRVPLHLQTPCRQWFGRVRNACSGRVFAVKTNVALQSRLKSWRLQVVVQCAFLFFFVILLVAWRKTFTQVCGVGGLRGLFST